MIPDQISAGQLRHVVEIQDYTMVQDSSGDEAKSYGEGSSAFATVHAEIKNLRGRELLAAQQIFAEATTQIRTRYLAGVNARMRIKHEDVYYDILFVDDVELRHVELRFLCSSGVSDDK